LPKDRSISGTFIISGRIVVQRSEVPRLNGLVTSVMASLSVTTQHGSMA